MLLVIAIKHEASLSVYSAGMLALCFVGRHVLLPYSFVISCSMYLFPAVLFPHPHREPQQADNMRGPLTRGAHLWDDVLPFDTAAA